MDTLQQGYNVLPPSHPALQLQGLARSIALPGMHAPCRFPSYPALERTAVMGFNAPVSLSAPASTTTHIILSRQAGWPAWATQVPTAVWSYMVSWQTTAASTFAAQTAISTFPTEIAIYDYQLGNAAATLYVPAITGSSEPPFAYPLLAVDTSSGPGTYMFVPKGGRCRFIVSSGGVSFTNNQAVTVNYDHWTSPGEVYTASATVIIGAATSSGDTGFTAGGDGLWIRVSSISTGSSVANVVPPNYVVSVAVSSGTASTFTPGTTNAGTLNSPPHPPQP